MPDFYFFCELILNGNAPCRFGDVVRINGKPHRVVETRAPHAGRQMVRVHGPAPADFVSLASGEACAAA